MSGLYVLGPDDEWTLVPGVSEIEPVLSAEPAADALFWPRRPWSPWTPETADERRQRLALERVRTSVIAAWNARR